MNEEPRDGRTLQGDFSRGSRTDGRLAVGVVLVLLGAALLLGQLRVLSLEPLARWWPALLIGLGAVRLFGGSRQRWGGYWILVTGIYGAIGEWNLFGLGFREAWPIFVIAAGVAMIGRAWFGRDPARRPV